MAKFIVLLAMEVEADTDDAAMKKADEYLEGMDTYWGPACEDYNVEHVGHPVKAG